MDSIPELAVVVLTHPIKYRGGLLPENARGTVVHVFREGTHYLVEFEVPVHVICLSRDDIRECDAGVG